MTTSAEGDAIRIERLDLDVRGKLLLRGFSLALDRGEKCTLTGPSGSGKSTILHCLLGFAKASSGRIEVLGRFMNEETVWAIRRQMAWVPQEPELGEGIVRDALEAPFRFRANRGQTMNWERARELAHRLRVDQGVLDQSTGELSGGEKQRISLLAALMLDRPILLLDEVTSALDEVSGAAVLECLRELDGTTILSVAHHPEQFRLGGRVVSLEDREDGRAVG